MEIEGKTPTYNQIATEVKKKFISWIIKSVMY